MPIPSCRYRMERYIMRKKVLDGDYPNLDFDGFGYTARLSSYDLKTRKKTGDNED